MKKYLLVFIIISLQPLFVNAQKKLLFDLSLGINKSIGEDMLATKITGSNEIQYYKKKKYTHPYMNVTGTVLYPLTKNFSLGLKSGIYVYFLETYLTAAQYTSVSVPIELAGRLKILDMGKNSAGIDLSAGINLYSINDAIEHYGNGKLVNLSLYYLAKNKHLVKIGLEKQIDNVQYIFTEPNPNLFNYKINRLAITLTYGIKF